MSKISDVAARAGVSKATASRALSGHGYVADETRRRVMDAARELDYVAHSSATSLATGRTGSIAVIVPSLERWFFAELVAGIQEGLIERDHDLALYCIQEHSLMREQVFDRILPRRRFDGLIAAGIQPSARELERLVGLDRPLVSVGPHHANASAVSIDDAEAARIATEHLIDLGHAEIAFIGGGLSAAGVGDELRRRGYAEAMDAADLTPRAVEAESTMPSGYASAAELLSDRRRRPTAVVGVCDEAAIGAIIAARRLGIGVPSQLSVVGVDDHRDAEMFALTTMRQRPRAQGRDAVRLLFDRLDDVDAAPEHLHAASTLIVRNSTAAPTEA